MLEAESVPKAQLVKGVGSFCETHPGRKADDRAHSIDSQSADHLSKHLYDYLDRGPIAFYKMVKASRVSPRSSIAREK